MLHFYYNYVTLFARYYVNQAAKLRASRVSQDFKFVKCFFIKFKIAETLEAVRLKRLSTIYPQKREVIHILSTGFGINPQTLQPCDFQRFFPNRCSPPEAGGARSTARLQKFVRYKTRKAYRCNIFQLPIAASLHNILQ